MNQFVPRTLLRDRMQNLLVHRMLKGAIPDQAYIDPAGKKEMVEFKWINQCPSRYRREVATSLHARVNTREQELYPEYLTRLRSKARDPLHTADGMISPLERGFTSVTNPASGFPRMDDRVPR